MLLGIRYHPNLYKKFRSEGEEKKDSEPTLGYPWSIVYVLSKPPSHCGFVFVEGRGTLHLRIGRRVCLNVSVVLVKTVLM
jgi:hypothetical protein